MFDPTISNSSAYGNPSDSCGYKLPCGMCRYTMSFCPYHMSTGVVLTNMGTSQSFSNDISTSKGDTNDGRIDAGSSF